jgi:hypothetical protein
MMDRWRRRNHVEPAATELDSVGGRGSHYRDGSGHNMIGFYLGGPTAISSSSGSGYLTSACAFFRGDQLPASKLQKRKAKILSFGLSEQTDRMAKGESGI